MRNLLGVTLFMAVLSLPQVVCAKPLVSVGIQAEKEVSVVTKGKKVITRVAATKIAPGDVILYTLKFVNSGDEPAINAVFDDPVPKGTVYLAGTALGENSDITFSIDGGLTFNKPSQLNYVVKGPGNRTENRIAPPEDYTHIRWVVSTIPAQGSGQLVFQVRMK
jgi:uncharacterized repeat protein (TIGR01451 family)